MIYKGTKKTASMKSTAKSTMNKLDLRKCTGVFAFCLLLLTASAIRTYAQSSLEIGVKGGGDYMKIGGRSFDGKHYPGFQAGVYGQLNFTSKWSLQPELNFSQTIGKTTDNFTQIYLGPSGQQVTLDYVQLPVLMSFKPVPELSLLLGPQIGAAVASTTIMLPPQV